MTVVGHHAQERPASRSTGSSQRNARNSRGAARNVKFCLTRYLSRIMMVGRYKSNLDVVDALLSNLEFAVLAGQKRDVKERWEKVRKVRRGPGQKVDLFLTGLGAGPSGGTGGCSRSAGRRGGGAYLLDRRRRAGRVLEAAAAVLRGRPYSQVLSELTQFRNAVRAKSGRLRTGRVCRRRSGRDAVRVVADVGLRLPNAPICRCSAGRRVDW